MYFLIKTCIFYTLTVITFCHRIILNDRLVPILYETRITSTQFLKINSTTRMTNKNNLSFSLFRIRFYKNKIERKKSIGVLERANSTKNRVTHRKLPGTDFTDVNGSTSTLYMRKITFDEKIIALTLPSSVRKHR